MWKLAFAAAEYSTRADTRTNRYAGAGGAGAGARDDAGVCDGMITSSVGKRCASPSACACARACACPITITTVAASGQGCAG